MANPTSWSRLTRMDVGVAGKETIFNGDWDLFDAIVNGNIAYSVTDDATLSHNLLSETQQCNGTIVFSGTLTAGRTISIRVTTDGVINARPGKWIFFNNTGQTLTFKLATVAAGVPTDFGSGATLSAGKKAGFYHTNPATAGASGDIFKWTTEV